MKKTLTATAVLILIGIAATRGTDTPEQASALTAGGMSNLVETVQTRALAITGTTTNEDVCLVIMTNVSRFYEAEQRNKSLLSQEQKEQMRTTLERLDECMQTVFVVLNNTMADHQSKADALALQIKNGMGDGTSMHDACAANYACYTNSVAMLYQSSIQMSKLRGDLKDASGSLARQ